MDGELFLCVVHRCGYMGIVRDNIVSFSNSTTLSFERLRARQWPQSGGIGTDADDTPATMIIVIANLHMQQSTFGAIQQGLVLHTSLKALQQLNFVMLSIGGGNSSGVTTTNLVAASAIILMHRVLVVISPFSSRGVYMHVGSVTLSVFVLDFLLIQYKLDLNLEASNYIGLQQLSCLGPKYCCSEDHSRSN